VPCSIRNGLGQPAGGKCCSPQPFNERGEPEPGSRELPELQSPLKSMPQLTTSLPWVLGPVQIYEPAAVPSLDQRDPVKHQWGKVACRS
jgi:hypothetical protein